MFFKKDKLNEYFYIFLGSILYTFGIQAFLQEAKTFSTGVGAFSAIPTFIWPDLLNYISLIFLGLNIPLLIFSYFKNNKSFTWRTLFFVIFQGAVGSLFLIDEVHNTFSNMFRFTRSIENLQWPIVILSAVGAVFIAFGSALCWRSGGSAGGSDIIVYFFSTKYKKSIGSIMRIISFSMLTFSFTTSIYFNHSLREHWFIRIISTLTFVLIYSVLIDIFFPKFKLTEVVVISKKWEEILSILNHDDENDKWFTFDIVAVNKKLRSKKEIKSIILIMQRKKIMRDIKRIDKNAIIYLKPVLASYLPFELSYNK